VYTASWKLTADCQHSGSQPKSDDESDRATPPRPRCAHRWASEPMEMNRHPTHDDQSAGALLMRLGRSATTGREALAPFAKNAVFSSFVAFLGPPYYLSA